MTLYFVVLLHIIYFLNLFAGCSLITVFVIFTEGNDSPAVRK